MSDEDEIVDPKKILIKQAEEKKLCKKTWDLYQACVERIAGDTTGGKNCTGWYMDHLKCIDHHTAIAAFKKLK